MLSLQDEILKKQEEKGFGSNPFEEAVGSPAFFLHKAIHREFRECLFYNRDGKCMLAAVRHIPFKGQFAKTVKEIVDEIVPQEEEELEMIAYDEEEKQCYTPFTKEEGFTTFQKVLAELKKIMESPPVPEEFLEAARRRDEHEFKVLNEFKEQKQKARSRSPRNRSRIRRGHERTNFFFLKIHLQSRIHCVQFPKDIKSH